MNKATQPCLNCGGTMVARRETVQVIGLPSVTVQNTPVWSCRACGEREVGFERIDLLHRRIATELIVKRYPLTSQEIRFLHGLVGLSGDVFAGELAIVPATLSRVENGKQPMGLSLERLFRFAVHTHLQLLPHYPSAILGPIAGGTPKPLRMSLAFDGEQWDTTVMSDDARRGRRLSAAR